MRYVQKIFFVLTLLLCVIAGGQTSVAGQSGMNLLRDEEIEQALKTMSRGIFQQAGVSPQSVRFVLVDNDQLNAFVAGGQNIFIHTGLILKTKNPQELIGVIAHETGHIALGHLFRTRESVDALSMQALLSNLLGVAVAIGAKSGQAGMAIGSAGQSMALRNILTHSRTQESSADEAGVRFLTEAHLPLDGFLSFMEELKDQELLPETQQSQYVRTHPLTQDRIDFLEHAVAQNRSSSAAPSAWTGLHSRMKAKLLGYLYPDRALQDRSDTPDTRYARAIAYYRKGQTDKSLPLIDGLLKQESQNPYLYELKAQVLFESGSVEASLPVYQKAVTLAPGSGLIRTAYGHALLEAKPQTAPRTKQAVEQLEQSINNEPRISETHRLLAVAYGRMGDEGRSRLHLAEQYMLQNRKDLARQEALLAKSKLKKGSAAALRADDILTFTAKKDKKED